MTKILIVEDKTENLYLMQSMLDVKDFTTISARNGAEALGLLRTHTPDLIISDILMPVMDGFTLCIECKKDKKLKNIPFIFYTATYTDPKDEDYSLSLGADLFILKPQEPDVFLRIITDFLKEVENKNIKPKKLVQTSETVVLKEYNEVLVRKIEDKMLQTEKAEKELRRYAEELEKEIQERKKKENSLLKSEEYNRLLFNTSPIGLALCKMDGCLVDINPAYARIIGRTIEETLKLSYWDLTPKKYADQEAQQLKNLKEMGHYGPYEKEYIHKEGYLVPILMQGLIIERDGKQYIWSTAENISVRKKTELELQKSQLLFQTLAEVSPVGIFRTNPNGDTTYINPKWTELSGLTLEESLGNKWLEAVHPEDRDKVIGNWKSDIKSKNYSNAEYRFLRKDGSVIWVMGNAVPEWSNSKINGYIGTITDITAIKKYENDLLFAKEKAEESDRLKSAFLANMSHEIRTPMNGILGFTELLKEPLLSGEEQKKYIGIIEKSGERMLNIISNIISISRIEAGEMDAIYSEINVNEQIEFIFDFFKKETEIKGLQFSFTTALPQEESIIKTDREKIHAILFNLVGNAIKFTIEGIIQFGYEKKGSYLEFYVKDTGCGIKKEQIELIFERFRQGSEFLTRNYEGAGLGLSISKAYVDILGGRMWVDSNPKGSVFYFTIPYITKAEEKGLIECKDLANKQKKITKKLKLLIVEDDQASEILMSIVIKKYSREILIARTGAEAIEISRNAPDIDLILIDIKMPEMDGHEATRQIRTFNKEVIIIAQTAYALPGDKQKAMDAGCNDYISKPINQEQLCEKINKFF